MNYVPGAVLAGLVMAAASWGLTVEALAVCDKRNSEPACGIWDTGIENPYVILAGRDVFVGTTIYRVCLVGKHPSVEIDIEAGGKVLSTLKLPRNGAACRDVAANGGTDLQVRTRPKGSGVRGTYLHLR